VVKDVTNLHDAVAGFSGVRPEAKETKRALPQGLLVMFACSGFVFVSHFSSVTSFYGVGGSNPSLLISAKDLTPPMRTAVDLSNHFKVERRGDVLRATHPDGYQVTIHPPAVRDDRQVWIDFLLGGDAGVGCRALIVSTQRLVSSVGWPYTLFAVHIVPAEGTTVLEQRLVAVYDFLHVAGAVVARAQPRLPLDVPWLRSLIDSARPDWESDEIVALTDFWK
jgi:hypothetical protein